MPSDRRRQRELNPPPPPLLDGLRLGHGSLAFGFLEPLLNACQVVRQPVGHRLRILRPVDRLGRKAPLGQGDEFRIRAAGVQPAPWRRPDRRWPPCGGLPRSIDPRYGGLPVRISHRIAPRPKTSARRSRWAMSPLACSGGMYAGVPRIEPASVSVPKLPARAGAPGGADDRFLRALDAPGWRVLRRGHPPRPAPWPGPSPSPAPRRTPPP